jgi:(p)ppGpp synthase/HD superfamily hydrolase
MTLWSQDVYLQASRFAAEKHNGQKVPGTELPYLLHLHQVTLEVATALAHTPDADANLALLCALLHDTVEDTDTTAAEIEARFGAAVARGVQALTKDETLPKDERMADSLRRILQEPREVAMVKMADRIVNLQAPPPYWSPKKIAGYRAEAEQIHAALAPASAFLAERLAGRITAYPP